MRNINVIGLEYLRFNNFCVRDNQSVFIHIFIKKKKIKIIKLLKFAINIRMLISAICVLCTATYVVQCNKMLVSCNQVITCLINKLRNLFIIHPTYRILQKNIS